MIEVKKTEKNYILCNFFDLKKMIISKQIHGKGD